MVNAERLMGRGQPLLAMGGLLLLAWWVAILPVTWLLISLGALAGGLLLLRWPWLIWCALAVALPVTSGRKLGPLSVTELLVIVGLALWFADGVRRRRVAINSSPVVLALAFYLLAQFLALLHAPNLGEAVAEVVKWMEVAALLLVVTSQQHSRHARWLTAALLLGGMAQAAYGLYQFIYRIGPEWFVILGRFMRASGSFGQPNPFGGYLGLSLPVALSLSLWAWHALFRQGERPLSRWLWAFFYTGATGVLAAALLASWSRGAWLGALAGNGLVIVLRSRRSALLSAAGLLIVLVALLLGSFQPAMIPAPLAARLSDLPAYFGLGDVLSQPVTDENFAVIERVAHWAAAVRMWRLAPWLGVGPGNYATLYPTVRLLRWPEPLGHAHNIYLNVLAETGLLGLWAFVGLWLISFFTTWRAWRGAVAAQQEWQAALALGVLGAMAHLSIHNIFDNLFVQGIYLHIALWLALVQVQHNQGNFLNVRSRK